MVQRVRFARLRSASDRPIHIAQRCGGAAPVVRLWVPRMPGPRADGYSRPVGGYRLWLPGVSHPRPLRSREHDECARFAQRVDGRTRGGPGRGGCAPPAVQRHSRPRARRGHDSPRRRSGSDRADPLDGLAGGRLHGAHVSQRDLAVWRGDLPGQLWRLRPASLLARRRSLQRRSMDAFLTSALLSVLLLPITANAVYVSDSGFGEALIYPYYTVRSTEGNAFNTYVSIANGDTAAKALRVRFREGRNGREVAGFNLFLGPRAIWAGAIVPSGAGARLISPDPACVSPALADSGFGTPGFVEFSATTFSGANADTFGQTVDRVREGYIEVLEMGALTAQAPSCFPQNDTAACPRGALPPCQDLRAERVPAWLAPRGYLYGTTTLINVNTRPSFTPHP